MKAMKKGLVWLVLFTSTASAQVSGPLTLDTCYKRAQANHPLSRQAPLFEESTRMQESVLSSNYLPQVSIGGQVSWQSDVTALPISIPNVSIPSLDKDSYKVNLDVNQLVWDGGMISRQKELEEAGLLVNLQTVEIENHRLRETVNQVFFTILIYQEREKLLRLSMSELQSKLRKIRSGVVNGTVLQSNADVLDAEIIHIEQSLTELVHSKASAIYKLGELTGTSFSNNIELEIPVTDSLPPMLTNLRPEYRLFELQQEKSGVQKSMTGIRMLPRISAFGTVGYGKPGLNMLSNQFDGFAMVGARFSWTIWNWSQRRKETRIIEIQQEVIETQKQNFEKNQRILLNSLKQDILKTENMIAADFRIVSLRDAVEKSAAALLDQGMITSTEYLTEKNQQTQAQLNLQLHKIQLQLARINYITASGMLK